MIGSRFGKLVVLSLHSTEKWKKFWLCQCDCGRVKKIRQDHLRKGESTTCGCISSEKISVLNKTHGKSKTRIYRIWRCMLNRCHYEKYPDWYLYGGRGITVCERWRKSFSDFLADMGEPEPKMSIDRINNESGYEPGNCRWATAKEQAANRRKPNPNEGR